MPYYQNQYPTLGWTGNQLHLVKRGLVCHTLIKFHKIRLFGIPSCANRRRVLSFTNLILQILF